MALIAHCTIFTVVYVTNLRDSTKSTHLRARCVAALPARVGSLACERPKGASEKNWSVDGHRCVFVCALVIHEIPPKAHAHERRARRPRLTPTRGTRRGRARKTGVLIATLPLSCALVDQFVRFHQEHALTNALFWPRTPAKNIPLAASARRARARKIAILQSLNVWK